MSVLDADFVEDFINMTSDAWLKGWHEREAGSLSYRLPEEEAQEIKFLLDFNGEWMKLGGEVKELGGEFFLITGEEKYFRSIINDTEDAISIIEINQTGDKYRKCWGAEVKEQPASELLLHLLIHKEKKTATNGRDRVIYHAHPANTIALTFILPLKDDVFKNRLLEMSVESTLVFQNGIGVVEWKVPAGLEIAFEASKLMKKHDIVIWAHHGAICSGENFEKAFGVMETLEKASEILIKVLAVTPQKLATVTAEDFVGIEDDYSVEFEREYLSE